MTLLNLDAPLVAVVWQELFARAAGISLGWGGRVLLFLAVWHIYLADRWLDAWGVPVTARHWFHQRWRWPMGGLGLVLVPVTLGLAASTLRPGSWIAVLVMSVVTAAYFVWTHWTEAALRRFVPKEMVVGAVFAIGSTLQVWTVPGVEWRSMAVPLALFVTLCFLNGGLITVWENLPRDREDPSSLLNAWPSVVKSLPSCVWITAAVGVMGMTMAMRSGWAMVCAAVAIGAVLLGWSHSTRARWGPDDRRLLADGALMAPVVLLFMM